jgi:hypothetical protein
MFPKSQRVGRGGNVLDDVEQDVGDPHEPRRPPRAEPERRGIDLVQETADALHRDPEVDHEKPYRQRERKRRVDVCGWNDTEAMLGEEMRDQGHEVRRQEVHRVHQQDPEEDHERRWRHEFVAVAMEDARRLAVNELEAQLDERLALARDAAGRPASHPPEETHADHGKGC